MVMVMFGAWCLAREIILVNLSRYLDEIVILNSSNIWVRGYVLLVPFHSSYMDPARNIALRRHNVHIK
jgi:hypothetical protein